MLRLIVIIYLLGIFFLSPSISSALETRESQEKGGSLVIIGGGLQLDNQEVYHTFIDSGGGKDNIRIAVIPAASITPVSSGASCIQEFGHYGVPANHIKTFPVAVKDDESTKEVDESTWSKNGFDKKLAEEILGYNAVFFVGGDQARYLETLKDKDGNDSPLLASIRKIYAAGGVLGGSSAGAAIMSDPMICGGTAIDAQVNGAFFQPGACPPESTAGVLLTRGLGFLEAGLVDQHFIKRGRCGRLIAALLFCKNLFHGIGIGIDEDTAAVYRAKTKTLEVIGRSGVLIVDTRKAASEKFQPGAVFGNITLHYLEAGDIFHTDTGTFTIDPRRKKIEPGKEDYESYPLDTNIFGKDAIKEIITAGLVDNRQKEAVGIGFRLEPTGKDTTQGSGKGVKLVFKKSEQTAGYYEEIEGRDTYSALYVHLDIFPISVEIRSESLPNPFVSGKENRENRVDKVEKVEKAKVEDKKTKKVRPGSFEDDFFARTELIMLKDEINIYKHLPDQEAREKFIEEFWKKRDPSPETELNESRMEFERRVEFVERFYKERVGKGRGWESDRGKVYLMLGEPEERSTQHLNISDRFGQPKRVLAEIWIYNYHRVYLEFVDADGLGIYRLRDWPVELLSAIERAKFSIQSPEKAGPSIKFRAAVKNNEIRLHIPIKSVSFSEAAGGMKARFKVTLFIYKDYEKIRQKEETMDIVGQKDELINRENIELTLPLDLPSPGKYLLDIVVEEMASGAKYRDLIKYKFK